MNTKKEPVPLPLKVGYYRLNREIPNPTPDRRSSDWLKRPTFKPGVKFWARRNRDREGVPGRDPVGAEILRTVGGIGNHRYTDISPWSDTAQWNALVGAIEPAPIDLEYLLCELGSSMGNGEYLLQELVNMGVVTLDHVRAAAQSLDEKWQKEEEGLAAKEAAKPL